MKTLIAAIIITAASTASADSAFYNSTGQYQGKIYSGGQMYNSIGQYQGKIQPGGQIYNSNGSYQGRIVTQPSYGQGYGAGQMYQNPSTGLYYGQ